MTLAALDHPGNVTVFSVEEAEGGRQNVQTACPSEPARAHRHVVTGQMDTAQLLAVAGPLVRKCGGEGVHWRQSA